MKEIEIFLEKRLGKNLGLRQNIEELFKGIDDDTTKVIMNFENVEFIGRSSAQEYLNQKHIASFDVVETNMSEDIEKLFNVILKLNNKI